ncbi:hypothetical protein D3C76_657560 [compost metagenome]
MANHSGIAFRPSISHFTSTSVRFSIKGRQKRRTLANRQISNTVCRYTASPDA